MFPLLKELYFALSAKSRATANSEELHIDCNLHLTRRFHLLGLSPLPPPPVSRAHAAPHVPDADVDALLHAPPVDAVAAVVLVLHRLARYVGLDLGCNSIDN